MASYICPHCHKQVKDLKGHTARLHPEQKEAPAAKPGAKTLELAVKKPSEPKETAQTYHCVDCGQTVTKGQASCPGCGTKLDWSHQ